MDLPGLRHRSLINGQNLTDVVITGKYNLLRHIQVLTAIVCLVYLKYTYYRE